ncbi:asparagine synthase C-terminal domain-containing protein [Salinigranum marinum]|uniref:asparagine synthase C-terminal domain-containing protein n=1 Tax=Salinigranum marinum TaxID=1515595 RepID=UPI002989DDAD|nr:asparagine synthase-related protein [Salinigranum marinum]
MARDVLRGAAPAVVRAALADRDPFPGTGGFAGALDTGAAVSADDGGTGEGAAGGRGGRVVRDVLGRQPVFVDGHRWSFEPGRLDEPRPVGAGRVVDLDSGDDARVWTLPDHPPESDRERAIEAVRTAVLESVRGVNDEGLAVAFSGGVDSALVASGVDAPCYVAGFPDSHDVAAAREAAAAMDRDLRVVELTHDDLRDAVPRVVAATGRTNPMDVGIALPLVLVAERARADGFSRLAVGQGADELFGGYAKVVSPAEDHRVDADTVRGARRETVETLPRQLERDVLALRAAGVEPVAPLLDDRVVRAALPLPGDLLATDEERKVALRRAAEGVVPASVAASKKKAVQYGSLVSRELDRLARQAGYKRRLDDHVGQYVRSLVDET